MANTKVKLLDSTITIPTGAIATTQGASDNTTKVATTAYVTTALANLADSAPSTLNTLNELAAALGDDANFSTTVTNSIATKLPLAGGTMTGAITGNLIGNVTGNVTGNTSGTALTVTQAAQTAITSLGTLTALAGGTGDFTWDNPTLSVDSSAHKVGIGTTAPSALLTIVDNDNSTMNEMIRLVNDPGSSTAVGTGAYIAFANHHSGTEVSSLRSIAETTGAGTGLQFYTHSGSALAERVRIDKDGNVGIGTDDPDYRLSLHGPVSTVATGPHIQATTTEDSYPVFQQLNWTHDNISLNFDSYYDGAWRSSDPGSNFQIYKYMDKFQIRYDSGIAAGNGVTWNNGLVMDTSGNVEVEGNVNIGGAGIQGSTTNPTITTNPTDEGHVWINTTSGAMYICRDNTTNLNVWQSLTHESEDIVPATRFSGAYDFFGDGSAVALWQFDGNAVDTGGNYDGEVQAGVSLIPDRQAMYGTKVADFQGSGFITIPFIANTFRRTDAFTISFWLTRKGTLPSNTLPFSFNSYAYNRARGANVDASKCYRQSSSNANNSMSGDIDSFSTADGDHFVVVGNTDATTTIYRNGSFHATSDEATEGHTNVSGYYAGEIGGKTWRYNPTDALQGTTNYNCSVDQFRIFNKAVTSTEVTSLYNEGA